MDTWTMSRESIDRELRSWEWKLRHPEATRVPHGHIVANIMRLEREKEMLPK